ncbi:thiol:disulfide interchange protein DsbA/DsbL [Hydrogenophaga sp.]|uniref:thiol:disulfide interchange protein DsbA/DsbL n=1 Tax=Hydrogenophaga sp. TaxID=1904254 RepID=UPI002724A373|nr:thiol:disulfide interchange protein DsbA/DsbL [Hydrogenophaga sp.]MDO8903536.1 thiol:disulfide interchange protein DsbA/DsbL [Hydrogenophaga sp.]
MQRRNFSRVLLAGGGLAAVGTLSWGTAQAQIAGLKEGTDYMRLPRPAPVDSAAGQVEVVEFFAYTCIHCYNFEPHITEWLKQKPAHVTLRRVPVAFSDAFLPLQRLYFALEAMGQVDALHEKVFKAIHVDKQRLTTPDAIAAWIEKQGVDKGKFTEFYNSFAVAGKASRATQLQDAYKVEGTPALGVAGRFYIPGQGPRTLAVANALIAEVRKG